MLLEVPLLTAHTDPHTNMEAAAEDIEYVLILFLYLAPVAMLLAQGIILPKQARGYRFDTGRRALDSILSSQHETRYQEAFCMAQPIVDAILHRLRIAGLEDSKIHADEKLLMFMRIAGHGWHFRDVAEVHGRAISTVSHTFNQVLQSILRLYNEEVSIPSDNQIAMEISSKPTLNPHFKDCVGAIDGSHISVRVPGDQQEIFRNRKGGTSWNVLMACGFDLTFYYVLVGWEGSAHDTTVLKDAYERGFKTPPGRYWLGDAGYSNSDEVMVPFARTRYHLREMALAQQRPQNQQELFNLRHSQLRNAVERGFGVLKRRFRILREPSEFSLTRHQMIIYACCVLHYILEKIIADMRAPADFRQFLINQTFSQH